MKFTKMHGCGNDYVYINGFTEHLCSEKKPEIVRFISDRHLGVGGDGVIFINPSQEADFEMEMYNADGSRAEMCGNGIRCVAKFVYEKGLTNKKQISVISAGKIKYLDLIVEDKKVTKVRVNMGSPIFDPKQIPVIVDAEQIQTSQIKQEEIKQTETKQTEIEIKQEEIIQTEIEGKQGEGKQKEINKKEIMQEKKVINAPIIVQGKEYYMTCVSMGNPHAVYFAENVAQIDLEAIGPYFENHKCFPKRINTEFVEVLDRKHIFMRVWERGTGETLACGTGSCAAAVACILNNLTDNAITVKLLGGELLIEWDREKNLVYMTGPAVTVFEGEIFQKEKV